MYYPKSDENKSEDCSSDSNEESSMFLNVSPHLQYNKINAAIHKDCLNVSKENHLEVCITIESVQSNSQYSSVVDDIPILQPEACNNEHCIIMNNNSMSPTENGPILLDDRSGIAIPPPNPLDLPRMNLVTSIVSCHQEVREPTIKNGRYFTSLETGIRICYSFNVQKHELVTNHHQKNVQSVYYFSSIISRAAEFLTAGDYGAMIKLLEILDKHLMLPEDIDMAKEFGQGLANYKNLHYRAAKPCFNALFEKSVNYHSSGNQALALHLFR